VECASPLALLDGALYEGTKSGRGLPHSKILCLHLGPNYTAERVEAFSALTVEFYGRPDAIQAERRYYPSRRG
jgi:hypothetical protein